MHGRRQQSAAEEVVAHIESAGRSGTVLMADVSVPDERAELVDRAWNWRGVVDIWVNNAGADVLTGDAAGWTFERKLQRLWDVDVAGTLALSRKAGRRMRAQGHGVIVNIGWDQAEIGMAGDSGEMFAATKGAVMDFTRSLAKSLAPQVRVNCVAPGWIKTEWGRAASEYWNERAEHESLLARWGTPDDVAGAVVSWCRPQPHSSRATCCR